ncbi:alpha/beta hydrolase-fold protein [Porticoccaceae bacterium]|nr:alpha/beta hydrolase-fold protein [Porticoccaceae bacterium]
MMEKCSLNSTIINEVRDITLYLPKSYAEPGYSPMRYPVVYLLDGEQYGCLIRELINHLSETYTLPEVILVAITSGTHRFRDLTPSASTMDWQGQSCDYLQDTGGLSSFLEFIEKELVPHIDTTYRTSSHRTLVGHSLAGLAVCQSLLVQPHLFQGLVSIDASLWWDHQCVVKALEENQHEIGCRESSGVLKRRFYCAYAKHEIGGPNDFGALLRSNQRFIDLLDQAPNPDLAVASAQFSNETHQSVWLPGVLAGLQFVFQGHRLLNGWAPDLETVKKHYRKYSERMGFDYLPPERLVDSLAWNLYPKLDSQVALELLHDNVKTYAGSAHARESLEQYLSVGMC